MVKRVNVSMTDQFAAFLEKYKSERGYRSLSAALLELAAVGAFRLGKAPPPIQRGWGGDRKSEDWEEEILERTEIALKGRPPLIDYDEEEA